MAGRVLLCSTWLVGVAALPVCNKHSTRVAGGHEASSTERKADVCGARFYMNYWYVAEIKDGTAAEVAATMDSTKDATPNRRRNLGLSKNFISATVQARTGYKVGLWAGQFVAMLMASEEYRRFAARSIPECRKCNIDPKDTIAHAPFNSTCGDCLAYMKSVAFNYTDGNCSQTTAKRVRDTSKDCMLVTPRYVGTAKDIMVAYNNWTCIGPAKNAGGMPGEDASCAANNADAASVAAGGVAPGPNFIAAWPGWEKACPARAASDAEDSMVSLAGHLKACSEANDNSPNQCYHEYIIDEKAHFTVMWEGATFEKVYHEAMNTNGNYIEGGVTSDLFTGVTPKVHQDTVKALYTGEVDFINCPVSGAYAKRGLSLVFSLIAVLVSFMNA